MSSTVEANVSSQFTADLQPLNPTREFFISAIYNAKNVSVLMKCVLLSSRYPSLVRRVENISATINDTCEHGFTALHLACLNSDFILPNIVQFLLSHKADVNKLTTNGSTPLISIFESIRLRPSIKYVIRLLIKAGADINIKNNGGRTALIQAMFCTHEIAEEVILILLEAGANVNARDNQGQTVLRLAIKHDAPDAILKTLINAGAVCYNN